MTPLSYLLAIASSITYGTADFLGGLTSRRASVLAVLIVSQGAGLVFIALVVAFMPPPHLDPIDYFWGGVAGITGGGGVALLYLALAIGTMSTVAPTTAVCAIVVPVLVGLALGERYGAATALGIVIAIVAIALLSSGSDTGPARSNTNALLIAVVAGVLIGFFFVALERGGSGSGLWPLLISRTTSFTVFAISGIVARSRWQLPERITMALIVLSGVVDVFANILYVLAVRGGSLGIVATIASLYPASTVVLARFILHERLRATQWAGVGCAGVAIVLIVGS